VNSFVQNLFNGVTFGMVLFFISAGLSIVMGVMGMTNLAHGAVYMIGAYAGWTVAVQLDLNYYLALIVGGLAAGAVGMIIERGFLRLLHKQLNEQVLVTFGFVLVLANLVLWIWGGRVRMQFTAPGLMGSVEIGGVSFAKTRIFMLAVGLVLALILWYIQDRTRVGAMVRAGMDDREMIMGLGVNLPVVSTLVFFVASFLAGFGGVMGSSIISPNPGMGLDILLLALIVTIVGGVGSIQGALLGGVVIGVLDTFGKSLFPQFGLFTMYFAMVVILLIRPRGLLGRRIR
jgi:branched-chain amino acid transport system permease protein